MKSYTPFVAAIAACLMAAAPAFAQTTSNGTQPNAQTGVQSGGANMSDGTTGSSTTAQKQHTQGLPAGSTPPQYGTDWARSQQRPAKTQ